MICSVEGCGEKTKAKGLCRKHYQRLRLYGRTDRVYGTREGVCSVEGCGKAIKGHGLCHNHNMMRLKYGRTEKLIRDKRKHSLYIIWWQRKDSGVLCERWLDFEKFVEDVSPKPEGHYFLVRLRNELFGPNNFKWQEHLKRKPGETKREWTARQWAAKIAANPSFDRTRHIKRKFGISAEKYDEFLLKQDFCCAICGEKETAANPKTGTIKGLSLDHNHKTGKMREMLCFRCNSTIGRIDENIELLDKMKNYLLKHKEI